MMDLVRWFLVCWTSLRSRNRATETEVHHFCFLAICLRLRILTSVGSGSSRVDSAAHFFVLRVL